MNDRKLWTVVLIALLAGVWLAESPATAEPLPAGAVDSPAACLATAPLLSPQQPAGPLLLLDSVSPAAAAQSCGCGDAVCVGKPVNFMCRTARFCQVVGVCSTATGPKCGCLPPP